MEVQQTLGGRYRLLNELGRGGMAVVWRARDEVLGRSVAVKLLAGRYADDPQSRARIRDEARAAATLSHPHIAQVYDFGESDEGGRLLPYVVMELLDGPTLAQRVAFGPLPPRNVFRICAEVAGALAAAHADGLVHRDIKPANVMVTPTGAKVVDFGIAAAAGPESVDDVLLGTPAYLAPERLTGDIVEPASDVYALGVLLYRLLADESPWSVESTTAMLDAHVYIEPAPLPQLAGVPAAITDLVHRCLRKDPAARPTAAQASAVLADAARSPAITGAAAHPLPAGEGWDRLSLWHGGGPTSPGADEPAGKAAGARPTAPAGPLPPGASQPEGSGAAQTRVPATLHQGDPGGNGRRLPLGVSGGNSRRRVLVVCGGVAVVAVAGLLLGTLAPTGSAGRPDRVAVAPAAPRQPSAAVDGSGIGHRPAPAAQPSPAVVPVTVPGVVPGNGLPRATESAEPDHPAGPTGTPVADVPSTAPPAGVSRELTSAGGSVIARCVDGGRAQLASWTPNHPYQVDTVNAGPAVAARVVFKHRASRIRMSVTCVGNAPTAVVLPL